MKCIINGITQEIEAGTISKLLREKKCHPDAVVVEVNEEILNRDTYDGWVICPNDVIEIVRFVGGG